MDLLLSCLASCRLIITFTILILIIISSSIAITILVDRTCLQSLAVAPCLQKSGSSSPKACMFAWILPQGILTPTDLFTFSKGQTLPQLSSPTQKYVRLFFMTCLAIPNQIQDVGTSSLYFLIASAYSACRKNRVRGTRTVKDGPCGF